MFVFDCYSLVCLLRKGDGIRVRSTADSTCCVDSIANQRELRLMISNDSCNHFPKMDSDFQHNFLSLISECECAGVLENLKGEIDRTFYFVEFIV